MSFFTRLKKNYVIEKYINKLPSLLVKDYNNSINYTPMQVKKTIERSNINSIYYYYATAMFCEKNAFEKHWNDLGESYDFEIIRKELADKYFSKNIDFDATASKKTSSEYSNAFKHGDDSKTKNSLKQNNKSTKDSAAATARAMLREAGRKKYKVALKTNSSCLAIDDDGNASIYQCDWIIFKGHYFEEWHIRNDEITKITLTTYPNNFSSVIGQFMLSGGLLGGIGGLAIGAVFDAIKGPTSEDVYIWFEFHTENSFPYACRYTAYKQKKMILIDENIEKVIMDIQPIINTVKKLFPGKFIEN